MSSTLPLSQNHSGCRIGKLQGNNCIISGGCRIPSQLELFVWSEFRLWNLYPDTSWPLRITIYFMGGPNTCWYPDKQMCWPLNYGWFILCLGDDGYRNPWQDKKTTGSLCQCFSGLHRLKNVYISCKNLQSVFHYFVCDPDGRSIWNFYRIVSLWSWYHKVLGLHCQQPLS